MPGDRTRDASDRDLAALQGCWEQVDVEAYGVSNPPEDEYGGTGTITTIEGCRFSVRAADGKLLLKGTFTLDALMKPKAITWTDSIGADEGKPLPASYELNDDRFVFVATGEGDPRPSVFHAGPGQVMRSFVRKK